MPTTHRADLARALGRRVEVGEVAEARGRRGGLAARRLLLVHVVDEDLARDGVVGALDGVAANAGRALEQRPVGLALGRQRQPPRLVLRGALQVKGRALRDVLVRVILELPQRVRLQRDDLGVLRPHRAAREAGSAGEGRWEEA
jgi:hypothetical protein